jgi:hypothetical protein
VVQRITALVVRILWTMLPFGSLGLFGWAPALSIARRRRTRAAYWWLGALSGSAVLEVVLLVVVPSKNAGAAGTAAGTFVVAFIGTASVYAWRGKGDPPLPRRPHVYGYPLTYQYPVAVPATAMLPSPFDQTPAPAPRPAPTPAPTPTRLFPAAPTLPPVPPPVPSTAPASDLAAEVQADLRELRGLLGGGDAE